MHSHAVPQRAGARHDVTRLVEGAVDQQGTGRTTAESAASSRLARDGSCRRSRPPAPEVERAQRHGMVMPATAQQLESAETLASHASASVDQEGRHPQRSDRSRDQRNLSDQFTATTGMRRTTQHSVARKRRTIVLDLDAAPRPEGRMREGEGSRVSEDAINSSSSPHASGPRTPWLAKRFRTARSHSAGRRSCDGHPRINERCDMGAPGRAPARPARTRALDKRGRRQKSYR